MPTIPRALRAALVAVAATLVVSGCGGEVQPRGYGDEYRENFMFGCTGVEPDQDPTLASRDFCRCFYDGLVDRVPFDQAREFEEQQAEAESGEDIDVPEDIQRVVDRCSESTDPTPGQS